MKNFLFSIFLIAGISCFAQKNLTLVIADKVEAGYFKQEKFSWSLEGIKNETEANAFLAQLKKNTNIKTAELNSGKTNGTYNFNLSVNKINGRKFFERLLYSCGVSHAIVNGKKEALNPERSKAAGK
jgi:hypothetical protein